MVEDRIKPPDPPLAREQSVLDKFAGCCVIGLADVTAEDPAGLNRAVSVECVGTAVVRMTVVDDSRELSVDLEPNEARCLAIELLRCAQAIADVQSATDA